MTKIEKIEGIGGTYAEKLASVGITSVEGLLDKGCTAKGRKQLEEATQISGKLILEWVNRADLFRVKGIGEEYADLLEAAGVDTVPELAQRNAENLTKKMAEVNEEKKIVRRLPPLTVVMSWVSQAKDLPRKVEY